MIEAWSILLQRLFCIVQCQLGCYIAKCPYSRLVSVVDQYISIEDHTVPAESVQYRRCPDFSGSPHFELEVTLNAPSTLVRTSLVSYNATSC